MKYLLRAAIAIGVCVAITAASSRRAAAQSPRGKTDPVQLVQVGTFGSAEPVAADMRTPTDIKVLGSVLARATDIDVGPDDLLYVLDAEFKKIAVFDSTGRYVKSIVGGYGKGPGEFVRPRSLTVLKDGRLAVLDQGTSRLSFFSPQGAFLHALTIPYSQPLQVLASDSVILLRRLSLNGRRALVLLRPDGVPIDSVFPTTGRDADFADFGENGLLSRLTSGEPVYARPTPGFWSVLRAGRWHAFGLDAFPDARGHMEMRGGRAVRVPALGVRGFAELADGTKLIMVMAVRQARGNDRPERVFYVLVFDRLSRHLGHTLLSDEHDSMMTRGFSGDDILVAAVEPFPHVKRYRVRSTGARSR